MCSMRRVFLNYNTCHSLVLPSRWTSHLSRHKSNRRSRTTTDTRPTPSVHCPARGYCPWCSELFSCRVKFHWFISKLPSYPENRKVFLKLQLTPKTLSRARLHFLAWFHWKCHSVCQTQRSSLQETQHRSLYSYTDYTTTVIFHPWKRESSICCQRGQQFKQDYFI